MGKISPEGKRDDDVSERVSRREGIVGEDWEGRGFQQQLRTETLRKGGKCVLTVSSRRIRGCV